MLSMYKKYGFFGFVRLVTDVLISRLFYPRARLLRRPFFIREEGTIDFGTGFTAGPNLILDALGKDALIRLGKGVMANHALHIGAIESVILGDRVLIASGVYISDHSHGSHAGLVHSSPLVPPNDRPLYSKPVVIGDDVWLGERVAVLPGVTIGRGVIVGAGAVVASDIPEYCIAAGIPARVIKKFDFDIQQWVAVPKTR